jgi:hypothetical protein
MIPPVFKYLCDMMKTRQHLHSDYMTVLLMLSTLCKSKPVASVIVNAVEFLPPPGAVITGSSFEFLNLLSPFLRLFISIDKATELFGNWTARSATMTQIAYNQMYKSLHDNYEGYLQMMCGVFSDLLKASPTVKERVLQVFHEVL